jgi:hypothetical protein
VSEITSIVRNLDGITVSGKMGDVDAYCPSREEGEDRPRATTRLPAGRMRAVLESMRDFSRRMTAATCRTKRLLRLRTSQPSPPLALASLSSDL